MTVLDRGAVVLQLRALLAGQTSAKSLAAWAFDQFYAEAEGDVQYEVGYRSILQKTLDDVMFGDDPHFQLPHSTVEGLIRQLETATYRDDPEIDDELEDEREGDGADE